MKNYKSYDVVRLGSSDEARVQFLSKYDKQGYINFNEDGDYKAYIVDEDCEIPNHYTKVETLKEWVLFADDMAIVINRFYAEEINIYRAGSFGCIIQLINKYEI